MPLRMERRFGREPDTCDKRFEYKDQEIGKQNFSKIKE